MLKVMQKTLYLLLKVRYFKPIIDELPDNCGKSPFNGTYFVLKLFALYMYTPSKCFFVQETALQITLCDRLFL